MMHPSKEKSTALGCIPHILSYIVLFEPRDMFESHVWRLVWRTRSAKRLNDICFWDFFIVARVATQFDTCSIYIGHTFWWTIQRSRSAADSLNILEGRALRQPMVLLVKWLIACVWKIEVFQPQLISVPNSRWWSDLNKTPMSLRFHAVPATLSYSAEVSMVYGGGIHPGKSMDITISMAIKQDSTCKSSGVLGDFPACHLCLKDKVMQGSHPPDAGANAT